MALQIGEDFPLVCEACLGGNPYVRMVKTVNGTECKISKRPCTMFEWRVNGVKKQTCVAYIVAAQKSICQCCMTDLTFGLPVNVRDAFMKKAMEKGYQGVSEAFGTLPQSQVGKDYFFNQLENARASAQAGTLLLEDDSTEAVSSLMKGALAHTQSFDSYKFKLPDICPGWFSGECKQLKRGGCGKRPCCGLFKFPELPNRLAERLEADLKAKGATGVYPEGEIKAKLEQKVESSKKETKVKDEPPKTLFVSNLPSDVTEQVLKSAVSRFPGVQRVKMVDDNKRGGKVAFIDFDSNESAKFVLSLSGIQVGSGSAQFSWARPKGGNDGKSGFQKRDDSEPGRSDHRKRQRQDADAQHSKGSERSDEMKEKSVEPKKIVASDGATNSKASAAVAAALKLRKSRGLEDD